ncbi:MAG: A24 family peptidase [Sphingomonas sp.]|uniref:A24 family peptidase n=1 Tax=Sphingomonas sp. TaxID=28214 RepID=UPI003F7DBB06
MISLHDLSLIALCGLLVLAAAMDVWKLRISNLFPAAVILLFPVWLYACGWTGELWQNAVVFIATFLGGLFLFSRGWLGGGDVKLMAAVALWFDFKGAAALYLWIGIGGAILAIVFVALRRMLPAGITETGTIPSLKAKGPIPYGLAISGGALLAIAGSNVNPQPTPQPLDPASLLGPRVGATDTRPATAHYIASAASIMMS